MGWIPGWEDALEEEMATLPSILAWEISWTEEPGRLQKRVRKDFVTKKQQNRIYLMDLWGGLDTVLRVRLSAQNVILVVGATFVTTLGSLFGGI